ncbi:MAG: CBO0543 family protein [Bacillota bacterium]
MDFQWDKERIILVISTLLSLAGAYPIIRLDWKKYGLLFVLAGIVGNVLCLIFVTLGFYSFPKTLIPIIEVNMPFTALLTVFPVIVLAGIRYSPKPWSFKIPFYWAVIHLGMLAETLALNFTGLISYEFKWDFWDSYTWWWIFLLGFEWIGGMIIPDHLRKPINASSFLYGRELWAVFHFILIITIFLGGYYLGRISR